MTYKLNIKRDVDVIGEDYILNTPLGYRMNEIDLIHVRGFDSMVELINYVNDGGVIPCDCIECEDA
jgi:hypothetical protein